MIAAESGPRPARDFINYVPTSRPGALAHAWLHDGSSRPFRPGLHAAGGFGVAGRYRGGQGRCPARRRPADRDPARRGRDRQPVSGPSDPDPPRSARGLARRRLAGRGVLAERAPYHFTHNEAHSPTQEARGDNHAAKRRHSGATAGRPVQEPGAAAAVRGLPAQFPDRTNISYAQLQMGADLDISLAAWARACFSSATPASACRPTSRCSASASGAGWLSCSWPGGWCPA